jgi:hypothetical protein
LIQIVFGIKASFGRTPKIDERTEIPVVCTSVIIALLVWSVLIVYGDIVRGDRLHALFAISNVMALGYGIVTLIGLRAIGEDFAAAIGTAAVSLYSKLLPRHAEAASPGQFASNSHLHRMLAPNLARSIEPVAHREQLVIRYDAQRCGKAPQFSGPLSNAPGGLAQRVSPPAVERRCDLASERVRSAHTATGRIGHEPR